MPDLTEIDPARVRALEQAENARFVAERPRSMALLEQATGSSGAKEYVCPRPPLRPLPPPLG